MKDRRELEESNEHEIHFNAAQVFATGLTAAGLEPVERQAAGQLRLADTLMLHNTPHKQRTLQHSDPVRRTAESLRERHRWPRKRWGQRPLPKPEAAFQGTSTRRGCSRAATVARTSPAQRRRAQQRTPRTDCSRPSPRSKQRTVQRRARRPIPAGSSRCRRRQQHPSPPAAPSSKRTRRHRRSCRGTWAAAAAAAVWALGASGWRAAPASRRTPCPTRPSPIGRQPAAHASGRSRAQPPRATRTFTDNPKYLIRINKYLTGK